MKKINKLKKINKDNLQNKSLPEQLKKNKIIKTKKIPDDIKELTNLWNEDLCE